MRLAAAMGTCLAALAAGARNYRLASAEPTANPDTYAAFAGGHVSTSVVSRTATGAVAARFPATEIGTPVSSSGYAVGSYLAPPEGLKVDWVRLAAEIGNQQAAKDGYVFFVDSETNANRRLVIARAGTFQLDWPTLVGDPRTEGYEASLSVATPYRLCWTSAAYGGAAATVPKNLNVRLQGDPALFYHSKTNAFGAEVCDYGVSYNPTNRLIEAYATDGRGPSGVFLVAYYDSGANTRYLGSTIVSVSAPTPCFARARVGDEVRPLYAAYDPGKATYKVQLAQTDSSQGGDARAPYFHVQERSTTYHAQAGRVFAITPTEAGEAGAKRAEISWMGADVYGTFWTLEQTCYHIGWPTEPVVAVGPNGLEDFPLVVPDVYTPKLLGWAEDRDGRRAQVASQDGNAFRFHRAGHCTLRLDNASQDDFVFMPLDVRASDDATAFPVGRVRTVPVGRALAPRPAEATAHSVVAGAPGWICEANSLGRNWSVNLYTNAAVTSSVHLVNVPAARTATHDVEVWWPGTYRRAGTMMTEPIRFPSLVERYRAAWPDDDNAQPLVIASGVGSAAGGAIAAGRAVGFVSADAAATCSFARPERAEAGLSFRLALHPEPPERTADVAPAPTGTVFAVEAGDVRLRLALLREAGGPVCVVEAGDVRLGSFACASNRWTFLTAVVATNELAVYAGARRVLAARLAAALKSGGTGTVRFGAAGGGTAAVATALDAVRVWNRALPPELVRAAETNALARYDGEAAVALDFDDAAVFGQSLFALDARTLKRVAFVGTEVLAPGAPTWNDGLFAAADGFAPRAYFENDRSAVGYRPNVEHALMRSVNGGFALYALRTDMNDEKLPPYVLAEYAENGCGAMRVFRVAVTNDCYAWPTLTTVVGTRLKGLEIYENMPSGACTGTVVETVSTVPSDRVDYRDRTGTVWARRDGSYRRFERYVGEAGFVCNAGANDRRDLKGLVLPALNLANAYGAPKRVRSSFTREELLAAAPTPFEGRAVWPASPPTMSVAQVLAKAESGLPGVYGMKSCAVIHPWCGDSWGRLDGRVVKLVDPTVRRTATIAVAADFPSEYGFTLGNAGSCYLKSGRYCFRNLPPNVGERLYVDTAGAGKGQAFLAFEGDYVEKAAGTSYLRSNTLGAADAQGIRRQFAKVFGETTTARQRELLAAVDALAALVDVQPSPQNAPSAGGLRIGYAAADHYALVATGEGTGYVVLAENDSPAVETESVRLHVLAVTNTLYCGSLVTATDPNNKLSEQANVVWTAPLGKAADDFLFEWFATDAPADGHTPTVPAVSTATPADRPGQGGDAAWTSSAPERSGTGLVAIDAVADQSGQITMKKLVNRYWTMHLRAKEGTPAFAATGGRFGNWAPPTLVEGWLQRVLNAVTPFAQRLSDLSSNKAELKLTMPSQIGAPWEGDVALNDANLNDVGLVQLYQTILNRAESMSVAQGAGTTEDSTTVAVNKQLVECVARLADMHMTLGAEAYSDAQNPTVSVSADSGLDLPLGSVFCFANQVPSLLDEELALLRGRTPGVSPSLSERPFYNRLMWNFTKGVTQGEVAYANNYNIKAVDGVLDANAAAALYPQGHGDAYGYYLSALKGYYRLLRNPVFRWGEPAMMEMLVADHVVNMDYQEEDKFAECAWNLAKIGGEVVKRTALKQCRDNAADVQSGYFDNPGTATTASGVRLQQAFGYGEWACRAGYGALCNWAVANALLPPDATNAVTYFTDESISTVTRQTSASLEPLAASVSAVEQQLNTVDAGGNVLGLDTGDIPFHEISSALVQHGIGATTPYEQMRAKAGEALARAEAALTHANAYGSRIRAIEDEQEDLEADAAEKEASYEKELVAIFGRPYAGDIGPGKTYAQGYAGPDLYHYMYMPLSDYGLSSEASQTITLCTLEISTNVVPTQINKGVVGSITERAISPTYNVSVSGMVTMPSDCTGSRGAEGEVQSAYRSLLSAYLAVRTAGENYSKAAGAFDWSRSVAQSTLTQNANALNAKQDSVLEQLSLQNKLLIAKIAARTLSYVMAVCSDGKGDVDANDYTCSVSIYKNRESYVGAVLDTYVGAQSVQQAVSAYSALLGTDGAYYQVASESQKAKLAAFSATLQVEDAGNDRNADVENWKGAISGSLKVLTSIQQAHADQNLPELTAYQGLAKQVGKVLDANTYVIRFKDKDLNVRKAYYKQETVNEDGSVSTSYLEKNNGEYVMVEMNAAEVTDVIAGAINLVPVGSGLKRFASFSFLTVLNWASAGAYAADIAALHLGTKLSKESLTQDEKAAELTYYRGNVSAYSAYRSAAEAQNAAAYDLQVAVAQYLARAQEYDTVLAKGDGVLAERKRFRTRQANVATQRRYADMYARVARNEALSQYRTAFDEAQRRVFELALLYDYETGLGAVGTPSGTNTFADAALGARALGVSGVAGDGTATDGGLWELVTRMDANYAQVKSQLGFNNPDTSERSFSLRYSNFRIRSGATGDGDWRRELSKYWREDVFADAEIAAHCQRPDDATDAQPGFVIPFRTSIYLAQNFFGKTLKEGDLAYSSSAQAVKVLSAGLAFTGYEALVTPNGLAEAPNVYLVPLGEDRLRLSDGKGLVERSFKVTPARFSTLRADGSLTSRQLLARSVWNDRWAIVIPASSLHADPAWAKDVFLNGVDGKSGVSDIRILLRAYSR